MDTGTIWTIVIVVLLICLVVFLKKDEFFPDNKKKVLGTIFVAPKEEPKQANITEEPAQKKNKQEKESSKAVWEFFKPILSFVLIAALVLWIGFTIYHNFASSGTANGGIKSVEAGFSPGANCSATADRNSMAGHRRLRIWKWHTKERQAIQSR